MMYIFLFLVLLPVHLLSDAPHSLYADIAYEWLTPNDIQPVITKGTETAQLSPGQRRYVVLGLFNKADEEECSESIITHDIRVDLEFFNRGQLIAKLNRTHTAFGEVILARLLAQPTRDVKELSVRQNIVRELIANQNLYANITQALAEIKELEPVLLSFFAPLGDKEKGEYADIYPSLPDAGDINETIGKSEQGMTFAEVHNAIKLIGGINADLVGADGAIRAVAAGNLWSVAPYALFYAPYFNAEFLSYAYGLLAAYAVGHFGYEAYAAYGANPAVPGNGLLMNIWSTVKAPWNGMTFANKFMADKTTLMLLPLSIMSRVYTVKKRWGNAAPTLQAKLMRFARALESLEAIGGQLEKYGVNDLVPQAKYLLSVLSDPSSYSEDMETLLQALRSDTFKGEVSFFSNWPRIFATNALLESTRACWGLIFRSIGYIDAYCSIAHLVKSGGYTLVEYKQSDRPEVRMSDFWSPMLDKEKAIANSIQLGGVAPVNAVITGPNSGGKSTIMKAVLYGVLLGQTLTVAPAKDMVFTPFSTVHTHMNIKDDVGSNLSGFTAEVHSARQLIRKVRELAPGDFSLTIIDEMFKSTAPDDAQACSYDFAKQLSAYPGSVSIHATHYHQVTELEKLGTFANYNVDIIELPNGTLKREYRLRPGTTTHSVARQIAHEMGLE